MSKIIISCILAVGTLAISCEKPSENVLLEKWAGPYGGVPAFDKMDVNHLKDAMETGIANHLKELDEIANNTEPATFENTILAMEKSGTDLDKVYPYYGIYSSNTSTDEFRAIEGDLAGQLSEYNSKITQNEKLFQRVKTVYEASLENPLPVDQQRVTLLTYQDFALNGAELDAEKKKRYAEINKELSELSTIFGNNVLHDEEGYITYLEESELGGLSEAFIKSAASAAEANGQDGKYAITNTRSSMDPFLTNSTERELREKVWKNYYARGDNGDEFDNNEVIVKILQLRNERVHLLGFDNYAQWRLQNRMAKTPENALALLDAVWPSAIARVDEEVKDMQTVADAEGANIKIEPWDYRFYAEKVRKKKYDLDSDEVKQYLQLDKLREAMFYVAGELFDFKFSEITDGTVPVFHEDVRVWEVKDKNSDKHIGLWYLDPYARKGKRSGAWATTYRGHTDMGEEETVLCSNNSNFVKGEPGEPVLISWDDATTFFHEMGHALHYLSANVKYPKLDGSLRDYGEFQSQLLERWLSTDAVIENYLVHYKTGESMPKGLVAKIKEASNFNQGFSTTEYMASAIMDMKYHMMDPTDLDVDSFERETLENINMPKELVMRHRSPHFNHVFRGEGYATAYYGYMWADVLTADAAEAFAEAPGGFYDKELAKKMKEILFAPRNTEDPAEAYRRFRGRDATIDALMRDRGFAK
ncbi:M3 family metallopeptidase [uncultured Arcticibacterium sp.]|uniref:M3 family metallopeptidase n=1 Tax=uncultured Arcticibacterium sp. TaxID=2173042 RepID=UPI0030F574BF